MNVLWRPLWVVFLCSVGWNWYFPSEHGASKKCGNDIPGEEVYVISIYISLTYEFREKKSKLWQ